MEVVEIIFLEKVNFHKIQKGDIKINTLEGSQND